MNTEELQNLCSPPNTIGMIKSNTASTSSQHEWREVHTQIL